MDLSPAGAAFVRHHEGFVGRHYLCPAKTGTIGIGFTWASSAFREWWAANRPGRPFGPGATMTRAEAEDALIFLMRREYGAAVNRFLGKTVAQHVFDGMASVTFNAGPGTLSDRWADAVKRGDLSAAADLLKTTRVTGRGKRLPGLISRRLDEAELIELADYTIGRPAMDPMADGMLVRGERGEAVRRLQSDLQDAGFYRDGIVDGIFGPGTEAAVMEFQRSAGLADDGYAGPLTLAALGQARAPVPIPSSRPPEPAPPVPTAPIGHNGGPPLEPAQPKSFDITVYSKLIGTVLGAIIPFAVAKGWLPEAASDPEFVAALIGIGAVIGTWAAPKNAD